MLEILPLWETDARLGQVVFGPKQDNEKESTSCSVDKWRVVGKEDFSGRLIVTCKSNSNIDQSYEEKSENGEIICIKIALLNLRTKELDIIFTCYEFYDILQCSVDQSLQRLAFICRTVPYENIQIQNSSFDSSLHDAINEEIGYMCYWTLLNPPSEQPYAIHPLNKESSDFMKVQFLSITQLLVFNPREAIYLYTLPSEAELTRNGLPWPVLYERLAGPFLFAEWNMPARQIFYLHLRCRPQTSHEQLESSYSSTDNDSVSITANDLVPLLVGLQIHPGSPFETVLNIPLDMLSAINHDVPEAIVETPDILRNSGPFSNKIYDPNMYLDMAIFTQPHGVVYICQGITKKQHNNAGVSYSEGVSHNIDVDIKYSVTMLHHGCTLSSIVQSKSLTNDTNQRILFTPFRGNCILVLVPGVFTHLLDVGLEHEPCNHVLTLGCELPHIEIKECAEFLCQGEGFSDSEPLSYVIHSAEQLRLFSVNVTSDSLLAEFGQCSLSSLNLVQQAILHHLLVHYNNFSNVEMALKDLVHDPTHPLLVKLFQEFLIGGAFARAKSRADDKVSTLLPVSVAEPFHPQQERFLDDTVQMTVTYSKLKDATSVLLSPNERHLPSRKMRDIWFRLWNHLRSSSAPTSIVSKRFSSKPMRDRLLALGSPNVLRGMWPSHAQINSPMPLDRLSFFSEDSVSNPLASFCNRFLGAAAEFRRALSGTKHKKKGSSSIGKNADRNDDADDGYSQLEHIVSLNLREITIHMSKSLPGETSASINNAACNYVADRLHQSQVLCHLLFQLLDVNPFVQAQDCHPYAFLNGLPFPTAKKLFMLLERYFVAIQEVVFPLPQGFEAFFSVLAYKCLDIRTFLQYVDSGVVQLNADVLDCIMVDATAVAPAMSSTVVNDDNVMLEIISRLSRKKAMNFLQHLKSSTCRLLQVHNIVDCYLHQKPSDSVEESLLSSSSNIDDDDNEAIDVLSMNLPSAVLDAMASFIRHLQKRGGHIKGNSSALLNASSSSDSIPSTSAMTSDLNMIRETQLANIAKKRASSTPYFMKIRPPISLWR